MPENEAVNWRDPFGSQVLPGSSAARPPAPPTAPVDGFEANHSVLEGLLRRGLAENPWEHVGIRLRSHAISVLRVQRILSRTCAPPDSDVSDRRRPWRLRDGGAIPQTADVRDQERQQDDHRGNVQQGMPPATQRASVSRPASEPGRHSPAARIQCIPYVLIPAVRANLDGQRQERSDRPGDPASVV
jgi:hypothetical protein